MVLQILLLSYRGQSKSYQIQLLLYWLRTDAYLYLYIYIYIFIFIYICQNYFPPVRSVSCSRDRAVTHLSVTQTLSTCIFPKVFFYQNVFLCLSCCLILLSLSLWPYFSLLLFTFIWPPVFLHPPPHASICPSIWPSIHPSVTLLESTRTTPPWPSWFRTNWTPTRPMTPLWGRWARHNSFFHPPAFLLTDFFWFHLLSHILVAHCCLSVSP